jgi:CheY-like chemotaxis protein
MAERIVILEDDARRREEMARVLHDAGFPPPTFFLTAGPMIAQMAQECSADLISLDHDLEPDVDQLDPGTGRDVANFLATRVPVCPVIIHSTNYPAALGMEAELVERGWSVERIAPYDDLAWVQEAWLPLVLELTKKAGGTP